MLFIVEIYQIHWYKFFAMESPLIFRVIFEVKNDKNLGILILTIRNQGNRISHFFREHQQPLSQHPEQVREAVKKNRPSVGRKKNVGVDIAEFARQYWNGNIFEFKGVTLNSIEKQSDKVYDRMINKSVGAAKRMITVTNNKQKKIDEKNAAIRLRFQKEEEKFQLERARRLAELFAPTSQSTNVTQQASQNAVGATVTVDPIVPVDPTDNLLELPNDLDMDEDL